MNSLPTKLISEFAIKLINEVPEFKELSEAKNALENDQPSKKLWEVKEEKRQTIDLMKKNGLPISESQQNEYSSILKEIRENTTVFRYLRAVNFANKVAGNIGFELFGITGADFTPKRGCV